MDRLSRLIAYRTLVKYLVLKDIKVKSRGTYLGVAWTLMNPLITIVTYFVVFQYVFRVAIPNFLAFFLVGLLMWIFFSRAISTAATCVIENDAMVKQAAFPLEVLPVASVLYPLFHHLVALGLAVPLMLIFWAWSTPGAKRNAATRTTATAANITARRPRRITIRGSLLIGIPPPSSS